MNVTHDLIAAVTGPGWKFGLSRILINDEGEGVVFIAGSQEPFASFTVLNSSTSRGGGASRGSGVSGTGDITWRRRGSSCQYKLAKCKVSTETMTSWWDASLTGGESEPETDGVPDGSAAKVMSWVGEDADRAQAALDAELANERPRVGLTRDLEKILAAEELL
jgi:hypothetical protein